MLPSYPKVWGFGHRHCKDIFSRGKVYLQEKVDGSQFTFMRVGDEVFYKSRRCELYATSTDKLFIGAISFIEDMKFDLPEGYIFRGEAIATPRHNTLEYARVPAKNVIIFDIQPSNGDWMSPYDAQNLAVSLGFEFVPIFHYDLAEAWKIDNFKEVMEELTKKESVLGKANIEGVVFKNYDVDNGMGIGEPCFAKYVREEFKEVNNKVHKKTTKIELLERIKMMFATEARWDKSIQHLNEDGKLLWEPRDIGNLIFEIQKDVEEECKDEIKALLWAEFWPQIKRKVTAGFPEYYKEKLLEKQFGA